MFAAPDGRRLSTRAYLRPGAAERYEFMRRVAEQVSECGIEIELAEMHVPVISVLNYPHIAPNDSEPFDLYFGGWSDQTDPDLFPYFHSSQCTTEEEPATYNYVCYRNARLDRLLEEGRAITDTTRRRDLYLEIQEILAEDQPYLFAWAPIHREALDMNLRSTAGELTLSSPMWDWEPEKLYTRD